MADSFCAPADPYHPGFLPIAAWEPFRWLHAGFSTRQGGGTRVYSESGSGEQNLGWTSEDDPLVVAENRRRLVSAVCGRDGGELVTMRQVHGAAVRRVERGEHPLATADGRAVLEADGLITGEPGVILGVQTADCVPLLLADTRTRCVAALHAGWRGTLAQIAVAGIRVMRSEFGSRPEDLIAAIGPAIGPCCFAVAADVHTAFLREFPEAAELFTERQMANAAPQLHLDLWEANRRQLVHAGLRPSAISAAAECTACARTGDGQRKYFSHRAEQGRTGRMMALIGVSGR